METTEIKNREIEITKIFTELLWNLKGDNPKPTNTSIQTVRYFIECFNLSYGNNLNINVLRNTFYKNAYSYIDKVTGKRKYLMNRTHFNKKYRPLNFEIKLNKDIYTRNYDKSHNDPLHSYKTISYDEWELIKPSYETQMKIYFLIQYHRTHNPQPYLKTSLSDIRHRCMINLSNDRILRSKLKTILNFFKENNIIENYTFKGKDLKIQIFKKKIKTEPKTVIHVMTKAKPKPNPKPKETENTSNPDNDKPQIIYKPRILSEADKRLINRNNPNNYIDKDILDATNFNPDSF